MNTIEEIKTMSDDSISDTGDINEGEGAKVVQSSFRESMKSKSIIHEQAVKIDPPKPPVIVNEKKPEVITKESLKISIASSDQSTKPIKSSKDSITKDFKMPKMNFIPIVNKDTAHPDTYNLNFLLDPSVQKIAKSGHRLTQSTTITGTSFISNKNHIKQNIQNAKSHHNSCSSKDLQNSYKAPAKRSFIDVDQRFYDKAKRTEQKVKELHKLKELEEINSCTFRPQITTKRKEKTYEEFWEYMNKFTQKKDEKVKNLKEEEKIAYEKSIDFNHQPKLCEKSMQIVARKATMEDNAFERLSKYYRTQSTGEEKDVEKSQKFFHPTVSKKSQMMQRTESVDVILYQDAKRRQNKEIIVEEPKPLKFITVSSEKVLIEKLKRDFEESFCNLDIDGNGELNYTRFIELLRIMNFVKDDSRREEERGMLLNAWKLIADEGEMMTNRESVLGFILAVMGFFEDWMGSEGEKKIVIAQSEVKKIHTRYDLFYTNRTTASHKSSMQRTIKENEEYSFHPNIGTVNDSNLLSTRSMNRINGKLEDHLIAEKERIHKKIQEKKILIEEEEMAECSFHPFIEQMPETCRANRNYEKEDLSTEYFKQLNSPNFDYKHRGLFLHDLSKTFREKKQIIAKSVKEREKIKEMETCTFTPHIEKRIFPGDYVPETKSEVKRLNKKMSVEKKPSFEKKPLIEKKKSKIVEPIPEFTKISKENDEKFCTVISSFKGLAKVSVSLPGSKEILEFKLKTDDPASVVMAFSIKFGLAKDQEYQLVKELTLLKYKNT